MSILRLFLFGACLTCIAHGRRMRLSTNVDHSSPEEAHGRDALAVLLLGLHPPAGFSLPAHGRTLVLNTPSPRKVMMNSNVKVPVAPRNLSEPVAIMSADSEIIAADKILMAVEESSVAESRGALARSFNAVQRLSAKLAGLVCAILSALNTRKAWMACAIGIGADLTAQVIAGARGVDDWIPRQTFAMAVWSIVYTGTLRRFVDKYFDRICGSGTSTKEVVSKQLVELFAFKPFIHVPSLYMCTGLLAGKGLIGSWTKLCNVYQETMIFAWILWVVPLWFYFRYVPYKWRVLYYSIFAFIQKCGFSYLSLPGTSMSFR